ncbi:Hypothetical protein NGAL_HAMBI1145_20330 [Neorhizobium galegae bv. officinalis]|jgi:hypothetical protein|uniref:DUF6894 domain-containing protein n=1 Tax=Neorhizobium galegae bv. officinalis TaxID=323656 RepID=A0A0T7FFZ4_NEOGA|nr:hypothetical protein [Neorhizobium galegae]CDZ33893.1 Hypothetical protein NGAL_HAMBI1145_20330 [Neorhizobium galegae bv. officinalis]
MTRYFFHIRRNGETVLDEEGGEFASLDDARISAVNAVRELVAAKIKRGLMILNDHMEVRDEADALQLVISFHEVIEGQLKR